MNRLVQNWDINNPRKRFIEMYYCNSRIIPTETIDETRKALPFAMVWIVENQNNYRAGRVVRRRFHRSRHSN